MNDLTRALKEIMIASRATKVAAIEEAVNATKEGSSLFCFRCCNLDLAEAAFGSKRTVAVCSMRGHLNRRFSVDYDIQKVMWTKFPRTRDDQKDTETMHCLAVIGEQNITFFNVENCHPFTYFVPFKIRNVYQMKYGLLIEQAWSSDEEFKIKQEEHIYLFSLTHPLNELLPVLYRPRDLIGPWLFCWEQEELSLIDAFDDFILTFDRANKGHRLFHVRRTLAEELKSSLDLLRIQQNEKRQHSTPKGPRNSTPKTFDSNSVLLQPTSIQTRSMHRLGRTGTLPVDSPALSLIGTPKNSNLSYDSTFRLKSSTQTSFMSSRGPNITKLLERDLNNDIFYADFCLECVWTEPIKKDNPVSSASKFFLTNSFCQQTFVNFFLPETKQLRCFRLTDGDHKSVIQTSFGSIACLDATYTPKHRHTVVLESDRYLTLYSGHTKICTISYPSNIEQEIISIHPVVAEKLALLTANRQQYILDIRPIFGDRMVEQLFNTCISAIASHDKATLLISEWRVYNSHETAVIRNETNICPLLHAAFRFLLHIIGITILKHPFIYLPEDEQINDQPRSKVRRPPHSKVEMLKQMRMFDDPLYYQRNCGVVEVSVNPLQPLFSLCQTIYAAMHSAWQQWGLRDDWKAYRGEVVHYLSVCAYVVHGPKLFEMYQAEFPIELNPPYIKRVIGNEELSFPKNPYLDNAFSLYKLIGDMLLSSQAGARVFPQIYTYSALVAQFILTITVGLGAVSSLVDVQRLLGKRWRKMMPSGTENELYKLIIDKKSSKQDKCVSLLKIFHFDNKTIEKLPCVFQLLIAKIVYGYREASECVYPQSTEKMLEFPSFDFFKDLAAALWPTDKRSFNVTEMLRSDKPVLINTSALSAFPNQVADQQEAQEIYLHGTCIRYLAQAFGRAMKSFRSLQQLPCHPENGSVAVELCLAARLFPSNMSYEIPPSDATKPYREWGEFYNGVASALRIGSGAEIKLDGEYLLSTCVRQDKISNPTAAGLLYGFALNGHLLESTYYVSEMLISLDEFQSVALLLGYGVAKMGTSDIKTHKMLGTQLPFIMGPTNLPIVIPSINQTAAVASLGFLFAQTGNSVLVRKLVNEIGKALPPEDPPALDRYAYRLNAGFAVGLICLGQGNDILARTPAFEEPQPVIVTRLIHMMKGHPRKLCVFPSNSIKSTEIPGGVQQPPSRHVKEREYINTHLSGHAACVALGLMFFQTNNINVARNMLLPETTRKLEEIKPDLVLARTLCYHLIMWEKLEPTADYVENMIPKVVHDRLHSKWIVETEEKGPALPHYVEKLLDNDDITDLETLAHVYCYVIAGTVLAIGLKFKNAHPDLRNKAFKTAMDFTDLFLDTQDIKHIFFKRLMEITGPNVQSLVINCLLVSLGLLKTATGDLASIRIARIWRVNEQVLTWMRCSRKHDEQLVSHQLLGMLFMGEGTYAFKEDILSNALLFIAFYPQVCHGINDSRFYHQPLRFLWTQAVEPRLIAVRTNTASSDKYTAKAEVTALYKDGKVAKFITPAIAPPAQLLSRIEIGGDNMETVKYDLTLEKDRKALENILVYNHGRFYLHDYRHDEEAITPEMFTVSWPDLRCEFEPRFGPTDEHRTITFTWPSLETISGIKNQMKQLQHMMHVSMAKGYVDPQIIFAEKLATWAEETPLFFALEHAVDMLDRGQRAVILPHPDHTRPGISTAPVDADKENEPIGN